MFALTTGRDLQGAYQQWARSAQVQHLADVDRRLTLALSQLRFERGSAVSGLALEPAKLEANLADLARRRAASDDGLSGALGILASGLEQEGLDVRPVAESYAAWKRVRADLDAALGRPVAAREPDLAKRVNDGYAALDRATDGLIRATEGRLRLKDARLSSLLRMREMSWTARTLAGNTQLMINDVLAKGRAMGPKEQFDYAVLGREALFAFSLAREIAVTLPGADDLKAATNRAWVAYFDGPFAARTRALMPALSDPALPRPTLAESRAESSPALDAIATVALAAVARLEVVAVATADEARTEVLVRSGLLLLVLTLGLGGMAWVAYGVTGPLTTMTAAMRRLAGGDTASPIPYGTRRDEIGAMAGALAVFRDSMIRTRRLEEETALARASAEEQRRAGMRQMADGFERAVGGIVGMVSAAASELQATAESMSATAGETASRSTSAAAAADQAAANVGTVAAAAEELGASVAEIARQVTDSSDLAQAAVAEATVTGGLVQDLSQAASRIGDVVALISSIAAQTNLLALNATIEAARAGEAGRGFAVVAAEVKELAGQTAKATDEISSQIARIQGSTGQAVQAIEGIGTRIREIATVAAAVAATVEQQGAATQEIVRNVAHAATGTGEVTTSIGGVAGAAEETGAAANQVLASASELSRQSEHLTAEVQRFLAGVRAA
ncbi:methyl-accepting chemotaxis protein [Methylobacterium sp. EM32]|uniref:methyl-accepting chemotaxis protein n=1 Tax=Methylobacterium sp. EM32 TaxID=3163481 RepID=UPI0033B10D13